MLSEVVMCNCVRNPGGHAVSSPGPYEEGVSFYLVLRPLDQVRNKCGTRTEPPCIGLLWQMPAASDRACGILDTIKRFSSHTPEHRHAAMWSSSACVLNLGSP